MWPCAGVYTPGMATPLSLRCPACDELATAHNVGGLAMHVCAGCGGVWFGSNQLKRVLAQGAGALDELMGFEPVESHASRKHTMMNCPECQIPLHSNLVAGANNVSVDTCYACGGLFLTSDGLARLDEQCHQSTGAVATPISAEARAVVAELENLTAVEQQRTKVMYQMLRNRETYRYGYRGGLWL